MIVAELKKLTSTDVSLETFRPQGPFGVYVLAMVGPAGEPGEESFGITVCTSEWFEQSMKDPVVSGRHHLFVKEYNFEELKSYLSKYCRTCMGDSWAEVAEKVACIGNWEFEDYRSFVRSVPGGSGTR
jgi:Immunity protein 8